MSAARATAIIASLVALTTLGDGPVAHADRHHASDDGDASDGDSQPEVPDDDPEQPQEPEEGSDDEIDQPKVTAGGNFLVKDFPLRETERPLTLIKGVTQVKLGLGTDLSAKGAFDSVGVNLDAAYGLRENFTLLGGFDSAYSFDQISAYAGFEGALKYDLIDLRVVANLHRNALPEYGVFCDPPTGAGEKAGFDSANSSYTCANQNSQADVLPTGKTDPASWQLSVDVGFPFRYAFSDSIAIVALQTLIGVNLFSSGVTADSLVDAGSPFPTNSGTSEVGDNLCHAQQNAGSGTNDVSGTVETCIHRIEGRKPDLEPSIGFLTSPIDKVSVLVQAQLVVPGFDTSAGLGAIRMPVTARVNVAASHKLDFGLEFILLNVIPPGDQSAFDNRFLSVYGQARF